MRTVLRKHAGSLALLLTLAIIALLGVLQHRWIARMAQAELQAESGRIQEAVAHVAADFDREITRAHFAFVPDPPGPAPLESAYVERMKQWNALAPFPGIVDAVWILNPGGASWRIARDGSAEPVTPPSGTWMHAPGPRRGPGSPVVSFGEGLGLAMPLPRPAWDGPDGGGGGPGSWQPPAIRVVELNSSELQTGLLRNLLDRRFTTGRYEFELRESERDRVISRPDSASGDPAARADLLAMRPDCLFGAPFGAGAPFGRRPGRGGGPGGGPGGGLARVMPPADVMRLRGADCDAQRGVQRGRWLLAVHAGPGSIATAAAEFRTRAAAMSFGVLALLTGSVIALWFSVNRARSLAQRQMEFAMSASHELRTPLTVMRLAGDNLASGMLLSQDQIRRYGETVRREAKRLGDMLEQLLLFARAHRPEWSIRTSAVEAASLIDGALEAADPLLKHAGIQVVRQVDPGLPLVAADANLITSALTNLLANAATYGRSGGVVTVTAERGAGVAFAVSDRGDGISRRDLRRMFEPFYRGGNSGASRGAGLGLHLVKRIVEAHGGRVSASGAPGQGVTVRFDLPAASEAEIAHSHPDR